MSASGWFAWNAGQRRLWDLAFEPKRGQSDARKSGEALIHDVAGLPAGEELGVEAVETFDLEDSIGASGQPAGGAFKQPLRVVDESGEYGKVE
jgi:hypothetical protein